MRPRLDVKLWLYSSVAMFILVSLLAYLAKYVAPPPEATPVEVTTTMRAYLYLGRLIFCAMFVFIYAHGYEAKPGLLQGLRYGIWMILLVPVTQLLLSHADPFATTQYLLGVHVASAVQILLSGLLVGYIYKPKAE
jgi:hypothetical protein